MSAIVIFTAVRTLNPTNGRLFENGNEPLGPVKVKKFLV
jgi:hypothetical protein